MNFRKVLREHCDAFLESARRFPLTLAFGAAGALMGAYVATFQAHVWRDGQIGFLLACWACVPLSFALGLLAEARRFGAGGRSLCAAAALLAAAAAWWTLAPLREDVLALRFALWFAAAVAAASIMPLLAGQSTVRFRHFNLVLLQRLLATVALAIPLFLGLLLALWAVRTLFGVEMSDGLPLSLWFFVTGVFGTAYFAGNAPRLDAADTFENPAFLRALTRFILLPLSLTYLIILYAYVVRILVLREWPQGMVSGLILAFAATGIATHLLLKDDAQGGRWARGYSRWFYLVLAPLVAMLFAAIWRRHSEYGLTEERALVWVGAFWLAGISAYFLLRRGARLEAIPLTLGLTAFVISVGPWSVFELSRRSQTERLERNLIAAGRWHDGKLRHSADRPDARVEGEISQILDYLNRRGELQSLRPWFSDSACAGCVAFRDSVPAPESLVTALGLEWAPYRAYEGKGEIQAFLTARDEVLDVRGYAFAVPVQVNRWNGKRLELSGAYGRDRVDAYRVAGDSANGLLLLAGSDTLTSVDLSSWAAGLARDSLARRGGTLPPEALRLDWSDARGRYSLRAQEFHFDPDDTARAKVRMLRGTLLIAPAPAR
jgi:hypothetical protein